MSKFLGFLLGVAVALAGPAVFGVLSAPGGIQLNTKGMTLAYAVGALVFWAVVSYFSGAGAIGAFLAFGTLVYCWLWIPNRTTNFLNDVPGVTAGMVEGTRQYTLNGVVPILTVISLVYAIQLIVRSVQRRRLARAEAERLQREQEAAQAQQEAATAAVYPVAASNYPAESYGGAGYAAPSYEPSNRYDDLFDEPERPRNQADEQTAQFPVAEPAPERTAAFPVVGNEVAYSNDDTVLVPSDRDETVVAPMPDADEVTVIASDHDADATAVAPAAEQTAVAEPAATDAENGDDADGRAEGGAPVAADPRVGTPVAAAPAGPAPEAEAPVASAPTAPPAAPAAEPTTVAEPAAAEDETRDVAQQAPEAEPVAAAPEAEAPAAAAPVAGASVAPAPAAEEPVASAPTAPPAAPAAEPTTVAEPAAAEDETRDVAQHAPDAAPAGGGSEDDRSDGPAGGGSAGGGAASGAAASGGATGGASGGGSAGGGAASGGSAGGASGGGAVGGAAGGGSTGGGPGGFQAVPPPSAPAGGDKPDAPRSGGVGWQGSVGEPERVGQQYRERMEDPEDTGEFHVSAFEGPFNSPGMRPAGA
ncbi:hypothetical protein ACFCV3_31630 [Kribbella sp. NPDC056345]|uniref:hypothetical protein n=1 Tax=Kribbella sp. NPDC056345 TaxID=3345789 RepID=UPI0035D8B4CD